MYVNSIISAATTRATSYVSSVADHVGIVSVGALAGGLIGQTAIPIPVLGVVVGTIAGGYITHKGLNNVRAISAGTGAIVRSIAAVAAPVVKVVKVVKSIVMLPFTILNFLLYPLYKAVKYMESFRVHSQVADNTDVHDETSRNNPAVIRKAIESQTIQERVVEAVETASLVVKEVIIDNKVVPVIADRVAEDGLIGAAVGAVIEGTGPVASAAASGLMKAARATPSFLLGVALSGGQAFGSYLRSRAEM